MTNPVIPAAAVEAAAKEMFDVRDDPYDLDEWSELDAIAREPYVCQARAALKAAAPYIRAQALLDAAHAAIDPTSEDMDKYFIDQSDTGRWLRARATAERGTNGDD